MRVLNQIINSYTTPQQRKYIKSLPAKAKSQIFGSAINITRNSIKELTPQEKAKLKAQGKENLIKDSQSVSRQVASYETSKPILQGKLEYLNNPENIKKQGIENTLLFLGTIGLKGIPKAQAFKVLDKLAAAYKKGGSKLVNKTVASVRNEFVKQNPKAAATIKKGTETLKSKQKEVSDALDTIFGKQQAKSIPKTKDYGEATLDEFFKAGEPKSELNSIADFYNKYGYKNNLLTTSKDQTKLLNKLADKGTDNLSSKEADSIMDMLKQNGDGLKKLAQDCGVKSKAEIPNFLKFVNQLGDVIKNAPNYIKSQATGKDLLTGLALNGGLSVYDLYQAYKDNDNSLLPKSLNNVARLAGGLIPGNPILKIFYGGLGYMAADPLTKAAFTRLGVKHETSDVINKEIEAGIYQPGLSDEIPEFIEGQSGRKYHVMGNKIFDYATGRPVNITNALQDASDFVNYKTQEALDKKTQLEQQENDLRIAMQQGYNVDPSQLQQIQIEKEVVQQQLNSNSKLADQLAPLKFDPSGDLVEQYKQKIIAPEQAQQQASQMQQDQQYRQTYNQIYEQAFNKIAQDTFDDMENYYTPQIQAIDYYEYNKMVNRGEAKPLTLNQFVVYQKQNTMRQLAPQIRQQADARVKDIINYESSLNDIDVRRYVAQTNALYQQQENALGVYKAEIDRMYKEGQLTVDQYNAITKRIESQISKENAITNRMNANTNAKELTIKGFNAETSRMNARVNEKEYERKQELVPFQQASYAGQTVMNAGMSGLSMDQFLNSNQSLFGKIFPGTQQGNQQDQTSQAKQNINNYYRGQK